MQLTSVGIARSIWLFDVNDLNPTGKSLFPDIMTWLGEKYSFQTFPKSIADVDQEKKGFLFKTGEFQSSQSGSIMVNFSWYSDGLVSENWSSTEIGDEFLEEILRSATVRYGLTYDPSIIRKQYVSEVIVTLNQSLGNINAKIARFCDTLNHIFARHKLPPFEMTGMLFGPDTSATSYKPPGLLIERKMGTVFSANRFWSKSAFTTKDHLLALEEFEKMLT